MLILFLEELTAMSIKSRIAAIVLSAVMTVSLASCGEATRYAAKSGDYSIPTGVYVVGLIEGFDSFALNDETYKPNDAAYWQTQVDGVTIEQKVTDYAKDYVYTYLAVEKKFDELGLTISEEELAAANKSFDDQWESLKSLYEPNGCGKESFVQATLNQYKRYRIFNELYKIGGEKEVPDAEVDEYIKQNFSLVKFTAASFYNADGTVMTDEEKQKLFEGMEDLAKKVNSGEDADEIIDKYNKDNAPEGSEVEIDTTNEVRNMTIFSRDQVTDTTLSDFVFDQMKVGENKAFLGMDAAYMFCKMDPTSVEYMRLAVYDEAVTNLKEGEFNDYLIDLGTQLEVKFNDETVKKYVASAMVIPTADSNIVSTLPAQ